jgi:hypothetical protein
MRRGIKGALALTSVEAFLAAAAEGSYAKAGRELGISATTIARRVLALEIWMQRPLVSDLEFELTEYGDEFVPIAWEVVSLLDEEPVLRSEITKARVHSDGLVTIEGQSFRTERAAQIGKLLVGNRASLEGTSPAPEKVSANDPSILSFLASFENR